MAQNNAYYALMNPEFVQVPGTPIWLKKLEVLEMLLKDFIVGLGMDFYSIDAVFLGSSTGYYTIDFENEKLTYRLSCDDQEGELYKQWSDKEVVKTFIAYMQLYNALKFNAGRE